MSATEEQVGQSIEDRAAEEGAEPTGQLPIPGTRPQLSGEAGGEAPESSTVKLRGGAVPIEGQFDKGEFLDVWVRVRVAEVHFVDTTDKYGNVTSTERKHVGRIVQTTRT